jgi:hypothetical protein
LKGNWYFIFSLFSFSFWWDWGLNAGLHACTACALSLEPAYFRDGISCTIFQGWPQTIIFPLSASQVARIAGVSLWHWAFFFFIFANAFKITLLDAIKVFSSYFKYVMIAKY